MRLERSPVGGESGRNIESVLADFKAEHLGQNLQGLGVMALDDGEVRLEAGADAVLDNFLAVAVGLDHDGCADELLRLIQNGTFRHEEAEAAVGLAADAEDRGLGEGFAAKVHGRTDLAVGMHADDGAR